MRPVFAKPERSLRSEIFSLLAVVLVSLGIISVFPYKAIGHKFKAAENASKAFASLVFLSEDEEQEAIQRARSAWQTSNANVRGLEIDLSMENLPEFESLTVLENPIVHSRVRKYASSPAQIPIELPSLAAEAPMKVESSPIISEKFFSDEDLMKLK